MSSDNRNRLWNCTNPNQGGYKRVLCVCSAGLLRSPSTAVVLSQFPFNFNTRAAGIDTGHALIPVDEVLLEWAQEIVCMEERHKDLLIYLASKMNVDLGAKPIYVLGLPDIYEYRHRELMDLIRERYIAVTKFDEEES